MQRLVDKLSRKTLRETDVQTRSSPSQAFRFLELPGELRLHIYGYCQLQYLETTTGFGGQIIRIHHGARALEIPRAPLLLASKQLRREYLPVVYRDLSLLFAIDTRADRAACKRFVAQVSLVNVRQVQAIGFERLPTRAFDLWGLWFTRRSPDVKGELWYYLDDALAPPGTGIGQDAVLRRSDSPCLAIARFTIEARVHALHVDPDGHKAILTRNDLQWLVWHASSAPRIKRALICILASICAIICLLPRPIPAPAQSWLQRAVEFILSLGPGYCFALELCAMGVYMCWHRQALRQTFHQMFHNPAQLFSPASLLSWSLLSFHVLGTAMKLYLAHYPPGVGRIEAVDETRVTALPQNTAVEWTGPLLNARLMEPSDVCRSRWLADYEVPGVYKHWVCCSPEGRPWTLGPNVQEQLRESLRWSVVDRQLCVPAE